MINVRLFQTKSSIRLQSTTLKEFEDNMKELTYMESVPSVEVTMTSLENGLLLEEDIWAMIGKQEAGLMTGTQRALLPTSTRVGCWITFVAPPIGTRPTPALTTNMATKIGRFNLDFIFGNWFFNQKPNCKIVSNFFGNFSKPLIFMGHFLRWKSQKFLKLSPEILFSKN